MEIWHRISFNGDTRPELKSKIEKLKLKYKVSPLPHHEIGLIHVDITEEDSRWEEVEALVRGMEILDVYDTNFTKEEIVRADWCRLIPVFEQGYPQPESSWSVEPITYAGYCPECGVFERQKESFQIKKEPRLGKNQFMSLYWTYALFTIPAVLSEFAANRLQGYEIWEVLLHKTDQPSAVISQIYMPHLAAGRLMPEAELKRNICTQCGTIKYYPHMRGYMTFNADLRETLTDFALSAEWFGDGHAAYREILVSNRVARLILAKKWQGVKLKPVQIVEN